MDNGTRRKWAQLILLSQRGTEETARSENFNSGRSVEQALKSVSPAPIESSGHHPEAQGNRALLALDSGP